MQATTLDETITIRLDPKTKALIERQAAQEDRKPGALARLLLFDGLRARGLLVHTEELQLYQSQRGRQA